MMQFRQMPCRAEVHVGQGPGGVLWRGDMAAQRVPLLAQYAGQVQTIYLDPPFNTGKTFVMHQRVGEQGWMQGKPALALPSYEDRWDSDEAFLFMIREAVEMSHALLRQDGSMFLHIDPRMHPYVRLIMDEVFGPKQFINEIVWAYQSGGRSRKHFSRKHDIILYYRKSPRSYFNISEVGIPRAQARRNHMKRRTDDTGRKYRSIVSQGKEYRYYDDDPVFPGDVWDDVSHLQQKDPQRTGYDNQKPARLLERILLPTSRPGDLVCDFFAGSGTTAAVAAANGRRFILVDQGNLALMVSRKRLLGSAMRLDIPCDEGQPRLRGTCTHGLGLAEVVLSEYQMEDGLLSVETPGIEAVEQLSVGYLRGDVFHAYHSAARSKAAPALPAHLELPVLEGLPAVLTVDVLGRRLVHVMEGV